RPDGPPRPGQPDGDDFGGTGARRPTSLGDTGRPARGAGAVPPVRGTGAVPPGPGAGQAPPPGVAVRPVSPGRGGPDVPRGRGGADLLPGRGTADVPPGVAVRPVSPARGGPDVPRGRGGADLLPGRGTADVPPGRGPGAAGELAVRGTGQVPPPPPVRAKAAAAVAVPPVGEPSGAGRATAPRPAVAVIEDEDSPGGLRGAGSELRAQLREKRRLRVLTLVTLSVVVLGLLPLVFGIRSTTRDPVFNSLDALSVPGWADKDVEDRSSGSRWCFLDCRFRERTAQSDRPFEETDKVYSTALASAGWKARGGECAEQPTTSGKYTCWTRDEFTLDLWVRLPECAVDAVAAQDPATLPSTGPDGVVATADPSKCTGSTVSIKVQNAITDQRGKPEPAVDPSLVGETPDPVLTNDPLLEPTPKAS
ncbi:hypothetical protein ACFFRK_32325, partial [Amorphoplanes digitatis]